MYDTGSKKACYRLTNRTERGGHYWLFQVAGLGWDERDTCIHSCSGLRLDDSFTIDYIFPLVKSCLGTVFLSAIDVLTFCFYERGHPTTWTT